MKIHTPEQLQGILAEHRLWLNDGGGKRAILSDANLSRADLSDADLSDADLSGADLSRADLSRANLRGADLSRADLSCADLSCANLRDAILSRADLSGADLRDAILSRADLSGADLSDAILSRALLSVHAPIIQNIDATILEAVKREGCHLEMEHWHTCDTTHCRAGWAIHLAGPAGKILEEEWGSCVAGALIYNASRPGKLVPNFYATTEDALADLEACAKGEK